MTEAAARAVLSDDGETISLTVYTEAGAAVPVALLPVRAVVLGNQLIAAAIPKLACREKSKANKRGGDPRAQQRRRDEALCELHNLTGEGKPLEPWSREIAQRLVRFQPLAEETNPERRLMQEVKDSGLPIGSDRIRKVVGRQ
jgi:hypothetical protein